MIELLEGKTPSEKASIKGKEIAKLQIKNFKKGKYDVEVVSYQAIPGGIEILARAYEDGNQVSFGDGTIDIERFRIINPPIITGGVENPLEALKDVFWKKILPRTVKPGTNIITGKVGSTTTTVFGSVDGRCRRTGVNETWATITAGAGVDVSNAGPDNVALYIASSTVNQWIRLGRYICIFDTSSIPDTDTISSATFTLESNGSTLDGNVSSPSLDVFLATPDSDAAIVAGDFDNIGTTSQTTGAIAFASLPASDGGEATWTFSATGIGNISKTGNSRFGTRWDLDATATDPNWVINQETYFAAYFVDAAGTTKDPVLVITHAAGSASSHYLLMGV